MSNDKIQQHFFTKSRTKNRFLFCSECALVQRSDNLAQHFKARHPYFAGKNLNREMFLDCGQIPRFPFTKRWEKYVKECITSQKSITKNQWLTISFNKKNNWINKNIKEGQKHSKVWFSSDFAVMSKTTWLSFKKKSWNRIKKIRS